MEYGDGLFPINQTTKKETRARERLPQVRRRPAESVWPGEQRRRSGGSGGERLLAAECVPVAERAECRRRLHVMLLPNPFLRWQRMSLLWVQPHLMAAATAAFFFRRKIIHANATSPKIRYGNIKDENLPLFRGLNLFHFNK